ncbi:MAG: DUF1275 domain-containing protein [Gemmataceae bacterium]|nr:DUF1275 domain-containing protein [Gemmataceae bacterium]
MSVTLHTPSIVYTLRHTPSWMMLAFAAGSVNAFAFLSCEKYVTHLTGTVTSAGLGLLESAVFWDSIILIVCFVAGAAASVIALQAREQRGKRPLWAWPLILVALLVAGTGVAGWAGLFGPLDEPIRPMTILCILSFAMGLQNASVATTTGLYVRTTHLTGPASDLGVHLGSAFFAEGQERWAALKGAFLRACKIAGFVGGAFATLFTFTGLGYLSLLPPACLILAATALSFVPAWGPSDYGLNEDGKPEDRAAPEGTATQSGTA